MQPELEQSVGDRARRVRFGHFSRKRDDEKTVELFLAWWENGRFAAHPGWLEQHVKNVEAIASTTDGDTLAIEHTSVYAFQDHQDHEKWLGAMAARIEAAPELQLAGRRFSITVTKDLFDELNEVKRDKYTRVLIAWLADQFASLPFGEHQLVVPALPPKKKPIDLNVTVEEPLTGLRPVSVSAQLPDDAKKRATPQIDKALKCKLPKLIDTDAKCKVLLVELPTLDTSPSVIMELIKDSPTYQSQLKEVNLIVLAKTHEAGDTGVIWFYAHNTLTWELGDIGQVTWG